MEKNYYVILGVSSNATVEEVKAAFRRRALELHPDRSGKESGPFLEVQEAYGVLSDDTQRRRYDRLARERNSARLRRTRAEPLVPEEPEGEPLDPSRGSSGIYDVSLVESFEHYRPSFDELFERLWSNFEPISRPKAERIQSLTIEITLTPQERLRGGQVRIWVPARITCPVCRGRGGMGGYECWRCAGQGALNTELPVEVEYPPGTRGSGARLPLTWFGIHNFYLTVHFRVL
jgi:molecular chaperone DnaJ